MTDLMTRIMIQLPQNILDQAIIISKKKGLSLAALIRMLLIEYLEKENK